MQKYRNIILGLVLVAAGAYFLLVNFGLAPELNNAGWVVVFGAISLLFLFVYVSAGWREWGWLFPVTIGASLAIIGQTVDISLRGEAAGSIFLWSIALPFWVARFAKRGNWWAVIPAGVLTVIGAIPIITTTDREDLIPVVIMFGLALVFALVYIQRRDHWWPIIPAGVLTTIGAIILLAQSELPGNWEGQIIGAVLFGGVALTFALLYWIARADAGWARYPAIALALMAAFVFITGEAGQLFFPILLIGAGVWILWRRNR
ncbi:MAG: hypothetical protein EPO32_10645 [Anaerolineae bacterium]|nr:MAG: hypothetical protein EPO32_10645 [Anaerolineae bacterium]